MSKITILVAGIPSNAKTALARVLHDVLKSYGIAIITTDTIKDENISLDAKAWHAVMLGDLVHRGQVESVELKEVHTIKPSNVTAQGKLCRICNDTGNTEANVKRRHFCACAAGAILEKLEECSNE